MADVSRRVELLRDVRIFLLGGVTEDPPMADDVSGEHLLHLEDEAIAVGEAVVSLARTVIAHGGNLLTIDDPLVTPLVSQVAWEYWEPPAAEPTPDPERRPVVSRVVIYRRSIDVRVDSALRISEQHGYVRVEPLDAVAMARPDAIVCIGGTDIEGQLGRLRGTRSVREHAPLVFSIESTGGAARTVSADEDIEKTTLEELRSGREAIRFEDHNRGDQQAPEDIPEFPYAAYPIIMRRIVERIADRLR